MYACFGFSLARSRRARTIDLQCQSLSLHRAFLLRSVCLSCMCVSASRSLAHVEQGRSICNVSRYLSVELFCFTACVCHCTEPSRVMPFAVRLTRKIKRKIITKIDRKSIPGDTSGPPKSTQNRSGTLSGHTMASKSVPKASRERLGSVPERPRHALGASGESPRVPPVARKGTLERLGARQGGQNRRQVASGSGKIEFSSRCAFAKHRRSDFSSIFVDSRFFRKVRNVCFVLRLPAKTEGRPFALRV